METMEFLESILNVYTIEIIFSIVVFKLILSNYKPPIQQSIQAAVCVTIGVALAMIVEPTSHNFMLGVIASGFGFYGGTYLDELRGIKKEFDDDEEQQ